VTLVVKAQATAKCPRGGWRDARTTE